MTCPCNGSAAEFHFDAEGKRMLLELLRNTADVLEEHAAVDAPPDEDLITTLAHLNHTTAFACLTFENMAEAHRVTLQNQARSN